MASYDFPPVGSSADKSVCLHETNGRLVYGKKEELEGIEEHALLCNYPKIEERSTPPLEQSLSPGLLRETFVNSNQTLFQKAVNNWTNKTIGSVVECVKGAVNGTTSLGDWFSSAGEIIKQARGDVINAFTRTEEDMNAVISRFSSTLNWSTNWVRCVAVHSTGLRIAVCRANDSIKIFFCNSDRPPITLKHECQKSVTDMAWKPFDRMVLAVACANTVLIWRLEKQNVNTRPSPYCAEVIEMSSFSPVAQCFWDCVFVQALFVVSASSSRIKVLDTSSGESETFGHWTGNYIRHIWISPNGFKLAVAYDSNFISVYDRLSWHEEQWTKLKGVCMAAVWSPHSDVLFFTAQHEPIIRGIHFIQKLQNGGDSLSFGSENAVVVYDLSEFIIKHLNANSNSDHSSIDVSIRDMKISPDGQRIAVTFSGNPAIIALFVVETMPTFYFAPCGLIDGTGNFGLACILSFFPKFDYGSLLMIVWSGGKIQYIPFLYGSLANEGIRLNGIKKNKKMRSVTAEDFLVRESLLTGKINSNASSEITEKKKNSVGSCDDQSCSEKSATSSESGIKLFSSVGLFDLLSTKSAEQNS
ncbi:unnamed protein product [Thelazia callipaeda]|uniref:ANAPC4_WD40 domain-containing protein n=1 Tax=Thelazia callipaeda TaxID=103827 RepID=A0A0N5CR73_THECL|nr:unnamed protein product [Thelazia callipaeda]